jgi:hypothetical protein
MVPEGNRYAVLDRGDPGEVVALRRDQRGKPLQNLAAHLGRGVAPGGEGGLRGSHRLVDRGGARQGNLGIGGPGRRIDLAVRAGQVFAYRPSADDRGGGRQRPRGLQVAL